jgi:hypothetical protein
MTDLPPEPIKPPIPPEMPPMPPDSDVPVIPFPEDLPGGHPHRPGDETPIV